MYLYKYLYKGPDQVKMYLEEYKRQHPDDDDELIAPKRKSASKRKRS